MCLPIVTIALRLIAKPLIASGTVDVVALLASWLTLLTIKLLLGYSLIRYARQHVRQLADLVAASGVQNAGRWYGGDRVVL